jgi:hypothetical protein
MLTVDDSGVASVKTFTTNDLSFSAYLVMKGITLLNAQRLGKTFKFSFLYDPLIDRYSIEYVGSDISRYDDAVRKLKRLVFAGSERNVGFL